MARRLSAIFLGLLWSACAFAVGSDTVGAMRERLEGQKKQVQRLAAQINGIEQRLGQENQRYLKVAKERKAIESKLTEMDRVLLEGETGYKKESQEIKKLLGALAINSLAQADDSQAMLEKKILGQVLKSKSTALSSIIKENEKLKEDVQALRAKLEENARIERELASLLAELEEKKRGQARQYMETLKQGKELESRAQTINAQMEWARKKQMEIAAEGGPEKGKFLAPLFGNASFESTGKKGVAFRCESSCDAVAPAEGTVVYVGGLSTYGNVVMIDHGDETRSVVLGPFTPSVQKGQKLKAGESFGNMASAGRLYFEVRKHNVAQETLPLLDKRVVAKNEEKKISGQNNRGEKGATL